MNWPFDKPIISPQLVGRAAHLQAISRMLARTAGGTGNVLLLAGEAGVGKSRLVMEARTQAESFGMLMLQGNCFEIDVSLPYAPLLDLLRAFLGPLPADQAARYLGNGAQEIVKLLPELALQIPGVAPSPALDPEQEKRRIFHTLAQFFANLSIERPLVVVIEDAHWSDDTSLEFLRYFSRRVASGAILLVVTYRTDEPCTALDAMLADLRREHLAVEITLLRLSRADADGMLRNIFGLNRPVRADFMEVIYGLTEGNPFFIEEVIRSLIGSGAIFYANGEWDRKPISELNVPRTVQDAVLRRLEHLSEAARTALNLAVVAGRRFDFDLLQTLTGYDEQTLLKILKDLVAAQLVEEESDERFAFRHALTQQAIFANMLVRERRRLHLVVAEAVESLYAHTLDHHTGELAHHYYLAGAWERAIEYSGEAGRRALKLYTPRAAIEHLSHALDAIDKLGQTPPSALLIARGQAYRMLGEYERAAADYETALRLARLEGDLQGEWQALFQTGILWDWRNHQRSGEHFRSALDLAEHLGHPTLLAHSMNRVGNWYLGADQPDEAVRYHKDALARFESPHDRMGIASTHYLLGLAEYVGADLLGSAAHFKQAADSFREMNERQLLVVCLASLALRGPTYLTDLMVLPEPGGVSSQADGEAALAMAREIGVRSAEAYSLCTLALCLGGKGYYADALSLAQQGLEIAREIKHLPYTVLAHTALGVFHLEVFADAEAKRCLEAAVDSARELGGRYWLRIALASLALSYSQQPDVAFRLIESVAPVGYPARTSAERLLVCTRAELCLAAGLPEQTLELADGLVASATNVTEDRVILRAAILRGRALAMLERWAEAEAEFRLALQAAEAAQVLPSLWRIRTHLARLYTAQSRRQEADQEAGVAHELIGVLSSRLPEGNLRETFARSAVATLRGARSAPGPRSGQSKFGGLTIRERQVALLVAGGKSNREIADQLVLGERTIETHVSNILAKLGFASRAQIAAWSVEVGLRAEE